MDIEEQEAAGTLEHNGSRYYFCSQSCLDKFKANPDQYLNPSSHGISATPNERQIEYTCQMDPEVRQFGPGVCPKCGMALEPSLSP